MAPLGSRAMTQALGSISECDAILNGYDFVVATKRVGSQLFGPVTKFKIASKVEKKIFWSSWGVTVGLRFN